MAGAGISNWDALLGTIAVDSQYLHHLLDIAQYYVLVLSGETRKDRVVVFDPPVMIRQTHLIAFSAVLQHILNVFEWNQERHLSRD